MVSISRDLSHSSLSCHHFCREFDKEHGFVIAGTSWGGILGCHRMSRDSGMLLGREGEEWAALENKSCRWIEGKKEKKEKRC